MSRYIERVNRGEKIERKKMFTGGHIKIGKKCGGVKT